MYKFRFIFRFIISITYSFLIIYDPWFRIMSRLLFNRYTIYCNDRIGCYWIGIFMQILIFMNRNEKKAEPE